MLWRILTLCFSLSPVTLFGSGVTPLQLATDLGQRGLPYLWGATDPQQGGLDCSGFIRYVYQQTYGLTLPDEAGLQYEYLRQHGQVWDQSTGPWSPKELQPGDLVFYSGSYPCTRPSPITHVMMYAGFGRVVGAQNMGRRLNRSEPGVGFYAFTPLLPRGDPRLNLPEYRVRFRLFAYGRVRPPQAASCSVIATLILP